MHNRLSAAATGYCFQSMAAGALLLVFSMLAACDAGAVARQAEAIRKRSVENERESTALSARKVREQWLVRDGAWYGKLPDGSLIRLESPTVSATTVKQGRPCCCKWLGEITVTTDRWTALPSQDTSKPFRITYTVQVRDSSRIDLVGTSGPEISLPVLSEITQGQAACQ